MPITNSYDAYYDMEVSHGRDPTSFQRYITDQLSPSHPAYTGPQTSSIEDIAMGELTPEAVEKCRKMAAITFPKAGDDPAFMKKYNEAKKAMDSSYETMWSIIDGKTSGDFGHARAKAELIYNKCSDAWTVMHTVRRGKYQDECVTALKMLAREHSLRFSPSGVSFAMPVFNLEGEKGHDEEGVTCVIDDLRCNISFHSGGVKILVKGSKPRLHGKWHPHVNSDGTPCTGEIRHYYEARLKEGDVYEATRVLIDALSNYNDASAYHKLRYFWGFTCACGNTTAAPFAVYRAVEKDGKKVKETHDCCDRCIVTCAGCSTRWHKEASGLVTNNTCIHCRTECQTCNRQVNHFQLAHIRGQREVKHCVFCCFGCNECGSWNERSNVAYVRKVSSGSCKIFCEQCGTQPTRHKHCIEVHLNDMPALKNISGGDLGAHAFVEATKLGLKTPAQVESEAQQAVPVTQGDPA